MTNPNPATNNTASPPTLRIDWIDSPVLSDQEHLPPGFYLVVTASDEVQFLYLEHFSDCTPENMYLGLAHALRAWANAPEQSAGLAIMPYSEHWKIGTIARELHIHPDAVRHAIEADRFHGARARTLRATITDPYLPFIRQILDQYPRLRATRIHQMLVERGYSGSTTQLRRVVATLRPSCREPCPRLQTLPGEQCQVDWAHFG